jgi:hypothetical protein
MGDGIPEPKKRAPANTCGGVGGFELGSVERNVQVTVDWVQFLQTAPAAFFDREAAVSSGQLS